LRAWSRTELKSAIVGIPFGHHSSPNNYYTTGCIITMDNLLACFSGFSPREPPKSMPSPTFNRNLKCQLRPRMQWLAGLCSMLDNHLLALLHIPVKPE
jgi:hypothetical protein